jgi:YrbI family 3-deoxy-D-manno-octulosonate 8-phosphate phosphatase
MIKQIAHRGNISGPNPSMENNPEYILAALKTSIDAEIDVWQQSDGFYLGHDKPTYKINIHFLRNQKLWVHCKDIQSFLTLSNYSDINCFHQEEEEIVITSRGNLWAHSRCQTWNNKTVIVKLDKQNHIYDIEPFAVCSDYIDTSMITNKLPFDLLIIDIDGVMTDGTKLYDRDGKVFGKYYADLDFTAIKKFKSAGIQVCFLSGDKLVNSAMAATRKITFFHNVPGTDKTELLPSIKEYYKQDNIKRIAYIGDDYYDIGIMGFVDVAFCPSNSPNAVKRISNVLPIRSGHGVISSLYDLVEKELSFAFPVDSPDVNPV